jgi:hypothetical protein
MKTVLRELVKKHFNLVDAPAVTEEVKVEEQLSEEVVETTTEETVEETLSEEVTTTFGEIKTADGELTLAYEGEELSEGLAIFVVTEDGNIPAPDGTHALEGVEYYLNGRRCNNRNFSRRSRSRSRKRRRNE